MAWQGIKTWSAGAWEFSDANMYIRDNMQSLRRYQTSTRYYNGVGTATTSLTQVGGTVTNMCTSTPDEATRTCIMLSAQANHPVSGGMDCIFLIYDGTGTLLESSYDEVTYPGGSGAVPLSASFESVAGVNPGFVVKAITTQYSCDVYWSAIGIVVPIT